MNTYSGTFDDTNWYQTFINGKTFNPAPSLKVRSHSPDGFAWGYGGSGPSQLALAILLKETDRETAEKLYMRFKAEVVAAFPKEKWEYTSEQVNAWIQTHEK